MPRCRIELQDQDSLRVSPWPVQAQTLQRVPVPELGIGANEGEF